MSVSSQLFRFMCLCISVATLLVGFGWELQVAHASYHGPIAFSLLAIAAALLLSRKRPLPGHVNSASRSSAPNV